MSTDKSRDLKQGTKEWREARGLTQQQLAELAVWPCLDGRHLPARAVARETELNAQLGAELRDEWAVLGVEASGASRFGVLAAGAAEDAQALDGVLEFCDPFAFLISRVRQLARPGEPLSEIAGTVPTPDEWPTGCRFSTRCPRVIEPCRTQEPGPTRTSPSQTACCHVVAREVGA